MERPQGPRDVIPFQALVRALYNKDWVKVVSILATEDGKRASAWQLRTKRPINPRTSMWPIHLACRGDAPLDVVKAFLDAYPEGIQRKTNAGYLPIHLAAMGYITCLNVIQFLVECYPEGLRQQDEKGFIPIHLAVGKNSSVDIVNLLVEAYPDGLLKMGKNISFPIHVAASNNPSRKIMNLLIQKCPESLRHSDRDGRLPLHYAAKNNTSDEVVKLLIESYPKGTRQKDSQGILPLHYASVLHDHIGIGAQTKKAKVLLYYDPESIMLTFSSPQLGSFFCKEISVLLGKLNSSSEMVQLLDYYEKKFFTTLARDAIAATCSRNQAGQS